MRQFKTYFCDQKSLFVILCGSLKLIFATRKHCLRAWPEFKTYLYDEKTLFAIFYFFRYNPHMLLFSTKTLTVLVRIINIWDPCTLIRHYLLQGGSMYMTWAATNNVFLVHRLNKKENHYQWYLSMQVKLCINLLSSQIIFRIRFSINIQKIMKIGQAVLQISQFEYFGHIWAPGYRPH